MIFQEGPSRAQKNKICSKVHGEDKRAPMALYHGALSWRFIMAHYHGFLPRLFTMVL
jgi:hypothetical protein